MADVVRYKLFLNNNNTIVEIFQREVGKTQRYMYIPANLTSKADAQTICDIITNGGNIANACVYDIINGGNTYYFTWKVKESLKRQEASVFEDVQDFLRRSTKATPTITASNSASTSTTNTTTTRKPKFILEIGDSILDTSTSKIWKVNDIIEDFDQYVLQYENDTPLQLGRISIENAIQNGLYQVIKKGQQTQNFKIGDKVLIKKDSEYYGISDGNPKDMLGEVIEVDGPGYIRVQWGNGINNSYTNTDLELAPQAQVPSQTGLPVFCLTAGYKKVGYIYDVNGNVDNVTGLKYWRINFEDGKETYCYRQEFFVEGDILQLELKGGKANYRILVSKITEKEIGYYYDQKTTGSGWSKTLSIISIHDLLDFKITVLDPIDDIASVAALNPDLNQQQAKPTIYAVDLVNNEIIEVKKYKNDDLWEVEELNNNIKKTRTRKNFFVVGDIIEATSNTTPVKTLKVKVVNIINGTNEVTYSEYDPLLEEFRTDLRTMSVEKVLQTPIKIVEYFNLRELFDEPVLVPKADSGTTPITPDSTTLSEIEQAKKDLGQLIFIRNLLSPIDFEQKIEVTQLIDQKQKLINDLNFKGIEEKMATDQFFDDLFEQSFTPIQHQYDNVYNNTGEEIDFFTPNGSRTQLSFELNEIIRTPQFKEWFGDWELAYLYKDADAMELECSKVLTPNFEPRVVWHGTGKQFSYFIFDNFPAAYFAVNREYSQFFADLQGGGDGYVIPFFLNIRNPLDLTHFETNLVGAKDFFDYLYLKTGLTMEDLEVNPLFLSGSTPLLETWVYIRNNPKMLKKIADTKIYDGIHFYESNPNVPDPNSLAHKTEAYITFSADQCKIADPNRGMLLFASLKSFLLEKGGKI